MTDWIEYIVAGTQHSLATSQGTAEISVSSGDLGKPHDPAFSCKAKDGCEPAMET